MKSFFFLCLWLGFCSSSTAQNDDLIQQVLQQLNLDLSVCKANLIAAKVLPHDTSETIVVIPEITEEDEDEAYFELNSHILIVDSKTGLIKHRFFENSTTNEWYSDAIRLKHIFIDTVFYNLAEETTAFGICLSSSGSSRPNPYSYQTLSLFVKAKTGNSDSLKRVLKNYVVQQFNGEWDTNCNGEFTSQNKQLHILKNTSAGAEYYDILVKNNIISTNYYLDKNEDCIEKVDSTQEQSTLKYLNGKYQ